MSIVWNGNQALDANVLRQRAERVAAGFQSLGIEAGDGIALYVRNDFVYYEASTAATMLGAYLIAVNWHYTPSEAKYLFEDSGAKILVIHADLLEPIRAAIPEGVKVLVVPVSDAILSDYGLPAAVARPLAGDVDWETWRDSFAPLVRPVTSLPSAIIYTSGTTGRPKGVKRPPPTPDQSAVLARVLSICYGFTAYADRPEEIVTAITGPIYHAAPNVHASLAFRIGANIAIMARFDAEHLLQLIQERRITHLNMVPIMFNRLLKLPEATRNKYDISSLKFVSHAAAPVSPPIKRAMIEWWGPIINEYYGSTEMGNLTFCTAAEWLDHPGTVGKAIPGAELRIIGPAGEALPPREIGEFIGRMHGLAEFTYHNDPAKRASIDKQGLIAPGDVGYFDEDGFLYLCDRKSDMIISGGVNIYPAEIEAELHKMPGLADCAVFGIPDDDFGEVACVVVQVQPGATVDEAAIISYLRARIAGYKIPKKIAFSNDLPREDSGKIFKRKLRDPYWVDAGRAI